MDEDVSQLARVGKDSVWMVSEQLDSLAQRYGCDEEAAKEKWLYLTMARLYESRAEYPDPLGLIEEIYADFDYPIQMRSFVRFLPPVDGRDPRSFTPDKNIEIMMGYWRSYLEDAKEFYLVDGAQASR